jgi:hypothetical protein
MPFSVIQCVHQQNNLNYDYLVQKYTNSKVFTDYIFIKLSGLNCFMQSTSTHVLKKVHYSNISLFFGHIEHQWNYIF